MLSSKILKTLTIITITLGIMLFLGFQVNVAAQGTVNVSVTLTSSIGSPLDGAKVMFKGGPVSPGTWFLFGHTGDDGVGTGSVTKAIVSGYSYTFKVEYNMTTSQKMQYIGTSPVTISFQTSKITVELKTATGTGLNGGKVKYRGSVSPGTWFTFGYTGSDGTGKVSKELFPGNWYFNIEYKQTMDQKQQDVGVNPLVTFTTTKVTILNSGTIKYYGNPSSGTLFNFTKPSMEMLPGTIKFKINGTTVNVNVSGASLTGGILTLLDHNGNGLAGGKARWADGSWHSIPGQTDANGHLWFTVSNPNFGKIAMTYNQGTIQQNRSQLNASNYTWQTALLRIELRDHANNLIKETPGGRVDQGGGYWYHHGYTGSSGYVDVELFPRSSAYKFRMTYNYISQTKYPIISSGMNTLVFQTGRLTLHFSGNIVFAAGAWRTFKKPSMEFLPVNNLRFRFFGCEIKYSIAAGDDIEKSIIVAVLKDHRRRGLVGGTTKYAIGGSWKGTLGTTDSNGKVCKDFDGKLGYVKVRMTYNQGAVDKTQYQPTNSIYTFQTVQATVKLIDHTGNGIQGGRVDQGGGYWQFHGYTNSNGELKLEFFSGKSYKIKVSYNGTSQTNWFPVPGPIVFQTGLVQRDNVYTGYVKASLGGSWRSYWPSPGSGAELLPGTYKFIYTPDPGSGSVEWVTVQAGHITTIPWGGVSPSVQLTQRPEVKLSPVPKEYALSQNYPNPFNPSTTIQFQLPKGSYVSLKIYDLTGREIRTLINKQMEAGYHKVVWDGTNNQGEKVVSGIYFYRIEAGTFSQIRRMILIK